MSDRKFGYIILFFFLLLVVTGICVALYAILASGDTRVVAFSEIGNLRVEDPVRMKGISVGVIKKIERTKKNVLVSVQFSRPLNIHSGYSFATVDQGLMGDRIIQISCGDNAAPLIAARDTLEGTFYPGVSEAIGCAWLLREVVDTLVRYSEQLLHGTSKGKSLVAQVKGVLFVADSLSRTFLSTTRDFDAGLSRQIDSIDAFVVKTALLSTSAAAKTPEYFDNMSFMIRTLSKALVTLDTTVTMLHTLTSNLQKPGAVLFGSDADNVRKKLVELREMVRAIRIHMLEFNGLF